MVWPGQGEVGLLSKKVRLTGSQHVVSYPFGAVVRFICYHSPPGETLDSVGDTHVVDVPKQHVIDAFIDWEPEVCVMLEVRYQCVEDTI